MESMSRRIKMEIVTGEIRLQKLVNRTTFKYCTDFGNNKLTAITFEDKIFVNLFILVNITVLFNCIFLYFILMLLIVLIGFAVLKYRKR